MGERRGGGDENKMTGIGGFLKMEEKKAAATNL